MSNIGITLVLKWW